MADDDAAGAVARKAAIAILVLLSFGSLVSSVDLASPFLPANPATTGFRGAGMAAHAIWLAAGGIGALAVVLLARRKRFVALLSVVVFAITYVVGAKLVWFQFTIGCWLAIAAVVLASFAIARRAA